MKNNFINSQGQGQVYTRVTDAEVVLPDGNVIRTEDLKIYGYTELSIQHQNGFVVKKFDLTKHPGFDELITTFGESNVRDFCADHKYGEEIESTKIRSIFRFVWNGLLARKEGKFKKRLEDA